MTKARRGPLLAEDDLICDKDYNVCKMVDVVSADDPKSCNLAKEKKD